VSTRTTLLGVLLGLVIVCATVLGALQVVNADRVLDLLGNVVASFLGALTGVGLLGTRASTVAAEVLKSLPPKASKSETDGA
jgi:hypothetical protein